MWLIGVNAWSVLLYNYNATCEMGTVRYPIRYRNLSWKSLPKVVTIRNRGILYIIQCHSKADGQRVMGEYINDTLNLSNLGENNASFRWYLQWETCCYWPKKLPQPILLQLQPLPSPNWLLCEHFQSFIMHDCSCNSSVSHFAFRISGLPRLQKPKWKYLPP